MAQTSGLKVRQHQREALDLRVEFIVADLHRPQLRFSQVSSAAGAYAVQGIATDISPGGMGLEARQMLPRMCEGTVRIYDPRPGATAADGTPVHEVIFEHRVKVRRIVMTDRNPTYGLGLSFTEPGPDLEQRVLIVLRLSAEMETGDA